MRQTRAGRPSARPTTRGGAASAGRGGRLGSGAGGGGGPHLPRRAAAALGRRAACPPWRPAGGGRGRGGVSERPRRDRRARSRKCGGRGGRGAPLVVCGTAPPSVPGWGGGGYVYITASIYTSTPGSGFRAPWGPLPGGSTGRAPGGRCGGSTGAWRHPPARARFTAGGKLGPPAAMARESMLRGVDGAGPRLRGAARPPLPAGQKSA